MTVPASAAPATTIKAARCDRPSCYHLMRSRPLRCERCGNTRLLYVEVRA